MTRTNFIYYTLTVSEDIILHLWDGTNYQAYHYQLDSELFIQTLSWLFADDHSYKISYRGGHIEKPLIVLIQSLRSLHLSNDTLIQRLQQFLIMDGSPTQRLSQLLKDAKNGYYQTYIKLLTHPLMLDIETFDGRIYHNRFDRLEIQAQLTPSKTPMSYLKNLAHLFLTQSFQDVFKQKQALIQHYGSYFSIPVNPSTTDAQLTESFYTRQKLKDADVVFVPQRFDTLRAYINPSLNKLFNVYQMPNPKAAIKKVFGRNGALTLFNSFVLSSSAGAPIGFQIQSFNPQKNWQNQTKPLRFTHAYRIDLTHIQSIILWHTVPDSYFKERLYDVLTTWKNQPDMRQMLNRLLYPIQGTMDTPFSHQMQTPNYAYSMRFTHHLILVFLLEKLVQRGMKPISVNNEVIFFEDDSFDQPFIEKLLKLLGLYYDIRPISQLIIKDTNNYTYFDERTQHYEFRGSSFNHHQGADVTTNMDTPPIVDKVLKQMIVEHHDFNPSLIMDYLIKIKQTSSKKQLMEALMVPLYPIKNREQFLSNQRTTYPIEQATATYATIDERGMDYYRFNHTRSQTNDHLTEQLLNQLAISVKGKVKYSPERLSKVQLMAHFSMDTIYWSYYQQLIEHEITHWQP